MTEATRTLLDVFSHLTRASLVYVALVVLILIMLANWGLPYFSVLKPQIVLVMVFYWMLYRPTLLPPWLIFLVGLVIDMLNPVMPLGTHAFSYLLIAGLLRPRRRMLMGQPFMMVWMGFIVAVLADLLVKMAALALFSGIKIGFLAMMINMLTTILLFPLIVFLLVSIHRLLPASRGMIAS